nr:hypothetical protein [Tanacetum cinerariifolium]
MQYVLRNWLLSFGRLMGVGRGVKENNIDRNQMDTTSSIGSSTKLNDNMNEDAPDVDASVVKEVVTPAVVDMIVEKENGKKLNIHTLFTLGSNGIDVIIPVESIRAISERFANTAYGFFLGKWVAYMLSLTVLGTLEMLCLKNGPWFILSHLLILNKWHPDENLLKEDVSTISVWIKLYGVPVTAFSEDGLSAIATKLGFKPQKEYRPVSKKPTTNSSGNKKKGVTPTIEVSNSNPFEVLNSVENDVEPGTNWGTNNLVNNDATSSGSSFMNIDNSSTRTTPIIDKIWKFKELLTSGKDTLVYEVSNPLKKVEYPDDYDSEDEVASVINNMARSMASEMVGFGTQSLLEQWRDSYGNGGYDDDPYDDDMYEGQDLHQELQAICDNLDIRNNMLILKKWHSDENILKEDVNTIPVWVKLHGVPVTAFSEDGLSAIATKLVMIELRADMELKDNIVVTMPKFTREGHYICNVHVEYELKPRRCIPVGLKMGFKPQKEHRPVHKKSTASYSGNKKKYVKPTIEVNNLNPFDVLNSVDNDVELGTNGRTTNFVNNGATSSESSFMNVDNSSSCTTIIGKIEKFKDLLTSRQAIFVDKDGNSLKNVEFPGEYDSEDEVASVDNNMAHSMVSEMVGFGTQSLLEQWRDSYGNDDYDDDPYDDDMHEGQDLSQDLQAICDNLDIRVRCRKKK